MMRRAGGALPPSPFPVWTGGRLVALRLHEKKQMAENIAHRFAQRKTVLFRAQV